MLKRMWTGDLSKEDRQVINSRVIGYNGLKLPLVFEGKQSENILINAYTKNSTKEIFIPELIKMTKHFIPNWKIMIY